MEKFNYLRTWWSFEKLKVLSSFWSINKCWSIARFIFFSLLLCHEKAWTSARACRYNSGSFQCFTLPKNTDSTFLVAIAWGYTSSCQIFVVYGKCQCECEKNWYNAVHRVQKYCRKGMRTLLQFYLFVWNTVAKLEIETYI